MKNVNKMKQCMGSNILFNFRVTFWRLGEKYQNSAKYHTSNGAGHVPKMDQCNTYSGYAEVVRIQDSKYMRRICNIQEA